MRNRKKWEKDLGNIIFESDAPSAKLFDIVLLISILLSIMVVFFDSVEKYHQHYGGLLYSAEWFFTILFTLEYILRIITARKRWKYVFSFYGIIDFLSIIPTYLSLLLAGPQFLIVIRILRMLRVFRILKLDRFVGASGFLLDSLRASRHKILVFLSAIMTIVVVIGALMYLIEGPANGFKNIPTGIYWAIVTITTVGYGDIAPHTFAGQAIASAMMILGYAIIAVPTGIITAEMTKMKGQRKDTPCCTHCNKTDHAKDATFCDKCGGRLK